MRSYQELSSCDPYEKIDAEYWTDDELEQYYTDAFIEEPLDPWHFNGHSQLSLGQCFFNITEYLTKSSNCPLLPL